MLNNFTIAGPFLMLLRNSAYACWSRSQASPSPSGHIPGSCACTVTAASSHDHLDSFSAMQLKPQSVLKERSQSRRLTQGLRLLEGPWNSNFHLGKMANPNQKPCICVSHDCRAPRNAQFGNKKKIATPFSFLLQTNNCKWL